jgi:hypothetical protein
LRDCRVGTISDPPLQDSQSVTDPQSLLEALAETVDDTVTIDGDIEVRNFCLLLVGTYFRILPVAPVAVLCDYRAQ